MNELWLYDALARVRRFSYGAKITLIALIGTHIPLVALIACIGVRSAAEGPRFLTTLGVSAVVTLLGTGTTVFVLHHLLRPMAVTAQALRDYRTSRAIHRLPTHYDDEAGALMADAAKTLDHLDRALHTLEYVDGLTGLPNRKRLVEDLDARLRQQVPFAAGAIRFGSYHRVVAALDLAAGEGAAREIAARIESATMGSGRLYRVSAQDFIFLIDGEGDAVTHGAAGAWLTGILSACDQDIVYPALTVGPSLRGGVAICPDDADTPDALIDDLTAVLASTTENLRLSFHSPIARQGALDRLVLEQDCRRALKNDEFVLHYQPVVDLSAGAIVGAEALIRWQHPERGLIPPAQFIGIAESSGLIDPIGLWVMRQACRQLREWNDSGLGNLRVAINLAARQFLDPGLIGFIDEAVGASRISANQLEIELTETTAMSDHIHTRAVFGKLRDLGVSIAIDDFGTGYASMSYLRQLPFDKLKIDREFVSDVHRTPDRQAICDALITLARGLRLTVLAEGTESAEEVHYLRAAGCGLYQGYLFSRPVPAAQFRTDFAKVSQIAALLRAAGGSPPPRERPLAIAS